MVSCQVHQNGLPTQMVNGQVPRNLQMACQWHLPAAGDAKLPQNILKRVANTMMALRDMVFVTRYEMVTKGVQRCPAARARTTCITRDQWQTEPPSEKEVIFPRVK